VLYHVDEVLATWKLITAPLLWVDGDLTDTAKWWGHRYSAQRIRRAAGRGAAVTRQRWRPAATCCTTTSPRPWPAICCGSSPRARDMRESRVSARGLFPTMDIEHINSIGTLLADLSVPAPSSSGGIFDYDRKSLRLNEVNAALENPAVWNDPKRAQELGREKKTLETVVRPSTTWPATCRQRRALRHEQGRRRRGRPAAIEAEAMLLRTRWRSSSSAACSATRPTR
jgi:hypothetical protein